MIREDGTIQYSNQSLVRLLDLDGQGEEKGDNAHELSVNGKSADGLNVKNMLEQTKIKKWS